MQCGDEILPVFELFILSFVYTSGNPYSARKLPNNKGSKVTCVIRGFCGSIDSVWETKTLYLSVCGSGSVQPSRRENSMFRMTEPLVRVGVVIRWNVS